MPAKKQSEKEAKIQTDNFSMPVNQNLGMSTIFW